MEELADRVNELIRDRTSYGVREEVAEAPGYVLTWSNGSARWFGGRHDRRKKGEVITLDANKVFVPGIRGRDLVYLTEHEMLDPLPLYGGSFERRMMGTPDYSGVELPPMVRVARDTDFLREEEVDRALLRKAMES